MDSDLTTATVVAGELGIDPGNSRLPRIVSAASGACLKYINRRAVHYQAAQVDRLPGLGRQRLLLSLTPVASVASVTLPDGTTLAPSEYSLEDSECGLLFRDVGWPSTRLMRPGIVQEDFDPGTERPTIVVTYAGGWVTPAQATSSGWAGPARSLPSDLEEACVQVAVSFYTRGGDSRDIEREGLGDYMVIYGVGSEAISPSARSLLEPYRRLN